MKKKTKVQKHSVDERVDITFGFTITDDSLPENKDVSALSKANFKPKSDLSYGQVEVIVSNSGVDRHGESITMEGIDTTQLKKNPVVLWAHDYSSIPIGSIINIWNEGGNKMARIQLATDLYEFANTVYKMILGGFINAVSIGGIVKEWNDDYTIIKKLEMVELSVVPVGAHPDALVTSKSLGIKPEEFKKQYEDFLRKTLVDKMKVLPQNEIELSIKALKSLTSALESSFEDSADTDDIEDNSEKNIRRVKKLIIVRQHAKQCDKQSELIIASINKYLKS